MARARRRTIAAGAVAVVGAMLITFFTASAAMANAPNPVSTPPITGDIVTNSNGTVTVNVAGTWVWPFSTSLKDVEGLHATTTDKCDHRFGAGWGVVWNDPSDSGYAETFTELGLTASVNIGSRGVNPVNRQSELAWMPGTPCGTFVETNEPVAGAGYVTGPWMGAHIYPNAASVPASICVVMYDLGSRKPPKEKWRQFSNSDNSITWSLLNKHYWNESPDGANCVATRSLPAGPPPVPATSPARVTSVATPTTAPPKKVPVVSPAALAFTGFGPFGALAAVGGVLLVLVGVVLYFVDVRKYAVEMRKLSRWLLGR